MSEDKIKELKADRWKDNKDRALNHKWYAIARMDLYQNHHHIVY